MSPPEETPLEVLAHALQRLLFVRAAQPGPFVVLPRAVLAQTIEDLWVVAAALRHRGQGAG